MLLLAVASGRARPSPSLARLVARLGRMGNTELNLISDFALEAQRALPRLLAETDTPPVPVYVYSVDGLADIQSRTQAKCPLFVLQDGDIDTNREQVYSSMCE